MLCQEAKGNPPERPAITHRNEPPELVAVNPSWDVIPGGPSTTPPPRTADPDEASTDGASAMRAADTRNGATQRRPRAAAIDPPSVGGVAEGPRAGWRAVFPAAWSKHSVGWRASRLSAADGGHILLRLVHRVKSDRRRSGRKRNANLEPAAARSCWPPTGEDDSI